MKADMKGCLFGIAAVMVLAFAASAQVPTPTPDNDVVKISTNLIQVDVSVTDLKGKVINDIKPGEIEIYENGEKQKITNFSFVQTTKTVTERPTPADKNDKNAIPIPQAILRPDQIRRTIALVVDDLSLSFESAYQTRRALKKFVDEQMKEGDLVAIIRTGAGIGALQQFTSEKRILYAAIEKVKWNPSGTGGVSAFAPIESAPDTSMQTDPSATPDDTATTSSTDAGQSLDDFRGSVFATGTLGALKFIVTGMSELPGRKSVILFSDGFKMFENDDQGNQESGRVMDFLKELIDVANRSTVVFYTVDARGLQFTGFTAADSVTDTSPAAMSKQLQARSDQLHDTQEGLSFLADQTGGFAVKNNNDLSGGVRKILDDQSYYLVAYEPDAETFDPATRKFNKLEVKILRSGAKVRYRSGFFNVAQKKVEKPTSALTPGQQLETALVSPFAVGGIDLRFNALFGSDVKTGSFVRSLLHINGRDLQFTDDKDGTKKATFDVLAMSFGDNGQVVDQLAKTFTLTLKGSVYQKAITDGFVYNFAFPVKKPGAYQYRVAIRDVSSGKIGSATQFIEVPSLKKGHVTLSSIILEDLTADQWKRLADTHDANVGSNPLTDTALRRVKQGTVLRYAYEIYNAKSGGGKTPNVQAKIRVFRDGKLLLDGQQKAVDLTGQSDFQNLKASGAMQFGKSMPPGDYILQIIVTDSLAGAKQQIATQFVQFEVVE